MDITAIGVGLLLFSQGRLLTVKELQEKPHYHKVAGMLSFPLETFEKKDRDIQATVHRLLQEELGISSEEIALWGIAPKIFKPIPGRADIAMFYGVGTFLGNPDREFRPTDSDVEIAGWKTPAELLAEKSIRVEVRPTLEDFFLRNRDDFSLRNQRNFK